MLVSATSRMAEPGFRSCAIGCLRRPSCAGPDRSGDRDPARTGRRDAARSRLPVFAINPKQLDRFRDRFTVAGAKDDSRDARVLGSSLRTDRQAFRRLVIDDPVIIELREWSRMADELQQERTRLANRIRQQLWRYYPQAIELTDDVADDWFLALWQQVPTPATAAKVSEKTITRLLKDHRIRRLDAATVLQTLRKTPCSSRQARRKPPARISATLRRACVWSISRSRRLQRSR